MILAEELGWISNFAFCAGAILIARKNIWGFTFQTIGNLLYIAVGRLVSLSSLVGISVFLIFINIYGIWCWKKGEN